MMGLGWCEVGVIGESGIGGRGVYKGENIRDMRERGRYV